MLDCELFELDAGRHHITNLVFHILNTLLLFVVLKQMTGGLWTSGFVAAAFALHSLHVESVAWVSERKDVLSTLLWILTMGAYVRYVKRPGAGRYVLTLFIFALGLMAKPMLVTLPFVLLLLDYWPLERFKFGKGSKKSQRKIFLRLVLEKLLFLAVAAVSCVITFVVQQGGGAMASSGQLPIMVRIANSLISYVMYILKMVWPVRLAVFYPIYHTIESWKTLAWQAAAAGAACSFLQARHWRNSISLFEHAISVTRDNHKAHLGMGTQMYLQGDIGRALGHYYKTIEINPNQPKAHYRIGTILFERNDPNGAIMHLREAARLSQNDASIHSGLGVAFNSIDKPDEAIVHFKETLRLEPNQLAPLNDLAWLLATHKQAQHRDAKKAIELAERERKITNSKHPGVLDTLAAAYASDGDFSQAIEFGEKAAELAKSAEQTKAANEINHRVLLYKSGRAYTAP